MRLLEPKYRRIMRMLAIPAVLIFVLTVIAVASGAMSLSYSGIAVDDNGLLYLGRGNSIEVYENGQKVLAFKPQTDKSFVFTVREGHLVLSTGKTVTTLDLLGNSIDQQTDENGTVYKELKAQRSSFTADDGTVYTLRHELLAARVVTNGNDVPYSEPAWANALKPLLILAGLYVILAAGYIALDRFASLNAAGHLEQVS